VVELKRLFALPPPIHPYYIQNLQAAHPGVNTVQKAL
jgi:hypothetical protein